MTRQEIEQLMDALRQELHACAELSGHEVRTRACLQSFLKEHTTLELHDCGAGFYAMHRESSDRTAALRADYDALAVPGGGAAHLCGHDGHAAALCGVALALEGQRIGMNVALLFQPAEETGEGAAACTALFEAEKVDCIFGAHNLPGFALGQVVTRPGTFACASRGVILRLIGKPTHAAYPENGVSPAPAVGQLLCELPLLTDPARYAGMTLCTVIGVQMGEKAFGAAAERAEVWLTLRGEHDGDLNRLHEQILQRAEALAKQYGLVLEKEQQDVFPSTENDAAYAQLVLDACGGSLLERPMRWSEDFGHYLQQCRGAYFGVGAGEDWPDLHTEHYEFPDKLLPSMLDAWMKLLAALA